MSLTTIDTDNYAEMAKAMGISEEAPTSSKSKSTLARLKINLRLAYAHTCNALCTSVLSRV